MSSRLDAICLHAEDVRVLADFWGGVLDRTAETGAGVDLVPRPGDLAPTIRFLSTDEPRSEQLDKVHLHLTSASAADQQATVHGAIARGAHHLDVGQLPEEGHVVLADPEGNAFCVIEPESSFLAGCGFLGELACDGTAAVGRFWSRALHWPLVWDEGEETAIQSPRGGTKIAWGGPPVAAARGRGGLHLDLVADGDMEVETQRLVELGASLVGVDGMRTVLADVDGNTFRLLGR